MAKIAKTGDRKKVMDTNKSTDCPKCSKPTRIVKRGQGPRTRHSWRSVYLLLGLRFLRKALGSFQFDYTG